MSVTCNDVSRHERHRSIKTSSAKAQIMRLVRSKIAALFIGIAVAPSFAGDLTTAKIQNCTWCHGTSAQGYETAPRLAGQRHQYIMNQLVAFRTHSRDNPFSKQYMWSATANLDPDTARDLATYFSRLTPKAANDGDTQLTSLGRTIYEDGNPDANIVSCAVCHGPKAEGIRQIPRLGGLSYSYLKGKLEQWGEGYHSAAEPPMPRIAGKLPPGVIDALASYLSFVK
jgi:cytochrome c553